ncbi:hypothetical protein PF005_g31629 [Phytophthora fragariae]|uniref:RxLR effector protein n=3 Tax=Phytophthora fragariae TaxID=53985 RepID=A0A6A3V3U7_9STRA|nr:hypothetical protein PF005_g31629 [Phytophthora fragariae]KAE9160976.1 hypothetical protein PF004_g30992 [Phytophthora fragariae]
MESVWDVQLAHHTVDEFCFSWMAWRPVQVSPSTTHNLGVVSFSGLYGISPIMRVCYVLLLAAATLLASATAVSESKFSTSLDVHVHSTRFLRVGNAADTNDEERAVPVLGKITSYLNQKILDFWLHQGKKPKQVFKLLKLEGLNGRAVTKRNHKYNVRYLAMWKNKNVAKPGVNSKR